MKIIVCENYEEMSLKGAEIVKEQVNSKPDCILGLATGSTPVGLYNCLSEMNIKGDVDFSKVTSFNLDEYYPISPENDQSYRYFMNENLFSKINIDIKKTHVPNGMAEDPEKACKEYDESILNAGGIDLQILGIGQNGHIAFNEPADELYEGTHITGLTESTIKANARFFEKEEDVPTKAVTMGIASIMRARKIIILANGSAKREIVKNLINGGITTKIPASILKVHPDVTLICDKDACPEL